MSEISAPTTPMTREPLRRRLDELSDQPCLVLDGGMGTALNKLGLDEEDAWFAPQRLDQSFIRDCVKRAHQAFLESGIDILTANTYCLGTRNVDSGVTDEKFDFNQFSIDNITLAKETIDEFMAKNDRKVKPRPLLAVSVGSFSTVVIDRAETANREQTPGVDYVRYKGYGIKSQVIKSYYHARMTNEILNHAAECLVSVLAIETVGDCMEVQVICDVLESKAKALSDTGISTWVTLTCLTTETVDTGGSVSECLEILAKCPQVTGLGINCTEPYLVVALLKKIKAVLNDCQAEDKLVVVYPNSGEMYLNRKLKDNETEHWIWKDRGSSAGWDFAESALEWVKHGAHIVGGCCRITATDIAEFVEKVAEK